MINDLKELTAFLKICRKQGINEIKFGDVHVTFGELPKRTREEEAQDEIEMPDELTPDELIEYNMRM